MDSVNSVNESLYFAAAQSISAKTASQTAKKEKTEKTKKNAFSDALKKSEEEQSLIEEGFPVEIAGMQIEEAAIFLKDAVDIAGDKMRIDPSPSNFSTYRKKVTLQLAASSDPAALKKLAVSSGLQAKTKIYKNQSNGKYVLIYGEYA